MQRTDRPGHREVTLQIIRFRFHEFKVQGLPKKTAVFPDWICDGKLQLLECTHSKTCFQPFSHDGHFTS